MIIHNLRQVLVGPAKSGAAATVFKDDVGSLERNVTENVQTDASVGLQSTEAGRTTSSKGGVGNVASRNGNLGCANEDVEVRGASVAAERVAALQFAVLGACDLGVVLLDNRSRKVKKSGTSVSNSLDGLRRKLANDWAYLVTRITYSS